MKLHDQVISLDLAKKLKELKIRQESLFYWDVLDEKAYDIKFCAYHCPGLEHYSAFIASELMLIIPHWIDIKKDEPFNNFILNMHLFNLVEKINDDQSLILERNYCINYHCDTYKVEDSPIRAIQLFDHHIYDENLANAAAKTIIRLHEFGYIKV